jgi:DNA-binding transcriptional MerR regulator
LDHKAPDAFRTISEVADELDLPQHVLRFWESRFHEIRPMKRGGGRRYYRPDDVELLRGIRHLLYGEGYTIRGVQRILREQGIKFVQAVWQDGAPQPPHGASEDEGAALTDATVEQPDGRRLLGRIPALLGRDLGDRLDDAAERQDPPLVSAPVPRVDAADRVASPPSPISRTGDDNSGVHSAGKHSVGLSREDLGRLHAALHELGECRKLIDAATAPRD